MKMDRNINSDGLGKYAVINLRKLDAVAGHAGTPSRPATAWAAQS